jgi:hypothetical protein
MSLFKLPDGKKINKSWIEDAKGQLELSLLYVAGERIQCLCHGEQKDSPLLYIKCVNEKYYLARMPKTQHLHAPVCVFSHEYEINNGNSQHDAGESSYIEHEDGTFIVKPSFHLERNLKDAALEKVGGEPKQQVDSNNASRSTLLGLLLVLWENSKNNRHYSTDSERTWNKVAWFLDKTVQMGTIGRKKMSDIVHIPLWHKDDPNRHAFWNWTKALANESESGDLGIIIGHVRKFAMHPRTQDTASKMEFSLSDVPCLISLTPAAQRTLAQSFRRHIQVLTDTKQSTEKVIGIFLVTNGYRIDADGKKKRCLVANKAALMVTTSGFIPVDSHYENQMATAMIEAGRAFVKPLRYDQTQDMLPDFIIVDEKPPIFVEVFGVTNNPEYEQRKQDKIAMYKAHGKKLLSWDVSKEKTTPSVPSKLEELR